MYQLQGVEQHNYATEPTQSREAIKMNFQLPWTKRSVQIESAGVTHIGKVREKNEDNYYYSYQFLPLEHNEEMEIANWEFTTSKPHILGVFDGMGGECAGELASYTAVSKLHELYPKMLEVVDAPIPEKLAGLLGQISNAVYDAAMANHYRLIGSTATMLFTEGNIGYAVNLGDSPMYRLRGGKLELMSHPHTDADLLKEQGIQRKPALTQFLGINTREFLIEPFIREVELKKRDQYLLCSDGLTDMVTEERIEEILQKKVTADVKCEMLLDEALTSGGRDNITIILCEVL